MPDKNPVEQLYAEHHKSLQRHVGRKLRQPQEAEDVVQEAFVRLVNDEGSAARGLAGAKSPVAYLYRIASNLAIDRLRQLKSRGDEGERGELDDSHADPQPGPAGQAVSAQRRQQLRAAIDRLPPKRRQVFVLHKYRQMTFREVAQHLGISNSMVEKHMAAALKQLQQELERP